MGIFNMANGKRKKKEILVETDPAYVYSPICGEVISLGEIEDKAFAEGLLGKGCGFRPLEERVVAPFDGEVVQVAETKHSIGIRSKTGIEVLIHIGMDTVTMNGAGFESFVKNGEQVKCGQLLMIFSIAEIEKAGFHTTTAVTVTNSDEYQSVTLLGTGVKKRTEKLIHVQ